jgi:phenylacetate-CoA ligase
MVSRLIATVFVNVLYLFRRVISFEGTTFKILLAPGLQPFLEWIGRVRAKRVFFIARKRCPAYQRFLTDQGYVPNGKWNFENVPIMTKENYVKKFSLEDRCYGGRIPSPGTVIDESSGSSGMPNNWVRNAAERKDVMRALQLSYDLTFQDEDAILLNCFALGPWATGMNVSMSLVDVGILKSIGPDGKKLESTLSLFGEKYRYLIMGYPPFLKMWLDSTGLDLSKYPIDAVVGGEGMSEGLRTYFLRFFGSVYSSYGASDLEINIGAETEFTVNLRRRCFEDRALCVRLFARESPPMIFQYNPIDYVIETNEEDELVMTIARPNGAAPKIRYNLKDCGGMMTYRDLNSACSDYGIKIKELSQRQGAFPIVYVFGRNDLSVPFYGAKIFPHDVEEIVNTNPHLAGRINSFQLQTVEDERLKRSLLIHLEKSQNQSCELPEGSELDQIVFDELCRVNQDFREVTKMFERSDVRVVLHEFETGVFSQRDIRVKNKYVA